MSDKSKIDWTDATWNPVSGCTKVSPGCDRCYAERENDSRFIVNPRHPRFGHPFAEVILHPERLEQPLHWAAPRKIFVNSVSDLYHRAVPDAFAHCVLDVMKMAEWHIFQLLTKRPERGRRVVRAWVQKRDRALARRRADTIEQRRLDAAMPANIWHGVSIESNDYVWRADMLRETPAAVRFLSLEPLLGPLDQLSLAEIDWVIVGGESGAGARAMDLAWARELRDRCRQMRIPFFFKQTGAALVRAGKGNHPQDIPEDLFIREFPDGVQQCTA